MGDKNTTILKHLHQVLYLINVGLNDDFQNQTPDFIKAFDAHGLYDVLNQVNPPKELKELLSHTKSRIAEARSHLLGHKVQADISKDETTSSTTGTIQAQCGNFMIFPSLRFYVRSILGILKVEKLRFLHFQRL